MATARHTPTAGLRKLPQRDCTGAAVANANYNLTGKRIRDLPIRLDKLL
jgi:hypothetical protein